MATSTEAVQESVVELPEGVTASFQDRLLVVRGKLGEVKKDFRRINVNLEVSGNRVIIRPFSERKRDRIVTGTVLSLIKNMVRGVTKGFTYKLKVVYAHFPISVKVKGDTVLIENFIGERSPRIARIVGDCKVTSEGDDIIVRGVSLEDVGQTAANLEQATRIKRKDQRVFLDGVYIYEKSEGW